MRCQVTVVDEYIEEVKENALHHMSADPSSPSLSPPPPSLRASLGPSRTEDL